MARMRAAHGLRQYLALSSDERWLFMRAFVYLFLIDVALRLFGLRRLLPRANATASPAEHAVSQQELRRACQYARWLEAAGRHHFIAARCLHRSLALHYWLHREGLPGDLRIGVRKAGGALVAHAWVEIGGHVVNDLPVAVATFVPLASASAPGTSLRHDAGAQQRERSAHLSV